MKRFLSVFLTFIIVFGMQIIPVAEKQDQPTSKNAVLCALYESDIKTIREAIDIGLITCEELTKYYIERIEKYNKPYNCFITLCDDAVEQARQRDEQLSKGEAQGTLFGIPVVIKDNIDLAGYYTTNGHYKDKLTVAEKNARVVDYLLEQGAVIIGKTNMSTDAQDARTSYSKIAGETKNAYNTLLAPGGSSGGTAVAVSLDFCVAGLGTDTNSSLRIPAILNGCVTVRPTLKKVSFEGCTHLNSGRDVIGAITRSVYDQAIMLDVLTNGEYEYTKNLNNDGFKDKKIGVLTELCSAVDVSIVKETDAQTREKLIKQMGVNDRKEQNIDPEIIKAFERAKTELESCGAEVVTVSLPNIFDMLYPTFAEAKYSYKTQFYNKFKAFMDENGLDAVVFPSYLSTPLKSGTDENGKNWNVWQGQYFINNCKTISPSAGMPAASVVIGYHSSGAGIGMEIVADKNCEQMLLDMAYTYTEKYNYRTAPTGTPNIYEEYGNGTLQELIHLNLKQTNAEVSEEIEIPAQIKNETTEENTPNKRLIVPVAVAVGAVAVMGVIAIIKTVQTRKRNKGM